jgi:hypothetical protein
MRFELTTSTLARLRSTPELRPRSSLAASGRYYVMLPGIQAPSSSSCGKSMLSSANIVALERLKFDKFLKWNNLWSWKVTI